MEVKGRLAGRGVAVWLPAHLRRDNPSLAERFHLPHFRNLPPPRASLADERETLFAGAERLVLSEENFIGTPGNRWGNLTQPLYKWAGPRLTALAERIAPDGIEVFVSLRNPATFLNSMYCQVLMGGRVVPLAKFLDKNPVEEVDWVDVLSRISAAPGVSSVTVWRYEDYRALFDDICRGLCGDAASVVAPVSGRVHRGLSQGAVELILDQGKTADVDAARDARPSGDDWPAFDAFDAEVHALSDRLYAAQCALIAQMPKVRFLHPATKA